MGRTNVNLALIHPPLLHIPFKIHSERYQKSNPLIRKHRFRPLWKCQQFFHPYHNTCRNTWHFNLISSESPPPSLSWSGAVFGAGSLESLACILPNCRMVLGFLCQINKRAKKKQYGTFTIRASPMYALEIWTPQYRPLGHSFLVLTTLLA